MDRALRRQWTLAAQLSIRSCPFTVLHYPKIMLGVLVAILCLDPVAGLRRLTREHQIARMIPNGVPGRAVLAVVWRTPSLRTLIPVPHFIHALDLQ